MEESALANKLTGTSVLITSTGSYLGASLVESLILENCDVFGVGNSPLLSPYISKANFTLLELDLNQPLPSYLPEFDLIFHLDEAQSHGSAYEPRHFSHQTKSIIAQALKGKTQVAIVAPISYGLDSHEFLIKDGAEKERLRIFLIGDLYGPKMPTTSHVSLGPAQKELWSLISQAVTTDKVILENEGLSWIYPTHIKDAIFAINKLAFSPKNKDVQVITSNEPISALSASYEIQNVASLVAQKQLGLFFSGPPQKERTSSQLMFNISHLGLAPKISLQEGLKQTFEYFKGHGLMEESPQPPARDHPAYQKNPPMEQEHSLKFPPLQKLSKRIPEFSFSLRAKNALVLIFLILFISILKTGFDIYLGVNRLGAAKEAIISGNFDKAKNKAGGAEKSFRAAAFTFKILSLPLYLATPQKIQSTNAAISAAQDGSKALAYFASGSQVLAINVALITSNQSTTDGYDLETPSADFQKAIFFSSKAAAQARLSKTSALFGTKIDAMQNAFEDLHGLSLSAHEATQLTGDLVGTGQKTYLILLQNNTELRPGGGFIGNFGTLEFTGGKLKAINVDDIYSIDGQLKEKIEPPKQLVEKLQVDNFYLRDSNWSADFALNSATARDLFKKETGKSVDGVIALDLTFVQDVLEKLGPVKLEDYNEEISAQNLFERGEYYSEVGFFPGSTQKRDFFGALSRKMISQILTGISQDKPDKKNEKAATPLVALVSSAKENLAERHIQMSFDNPTLASYVATHGWDSPQPPRQFDLTDTSSTRDFLAISEANLGANKVNRFLKREVSYEMTIGRDADLLGRLIITYTNNSQAETWPAGKYVNFLRVYVPAGSDLSQIKNGNVDDLKSVEVTTSGPLTTFATYVEVPTKSQKQISFTYRIPKNIKLETAPTYHFYLKKQPGTEKDPLEFKFNLPGYLAVKLANGDEKYSKAQNLTIQTDLAVDRQFEIEVAKK